MKKIKMKKYEKRKIWISLITSLLMIISVVAFSLNLRNTEEESKNLKFKIGISILEVKVVYLENETTEVEKNYHPNLEDFINKKFYFFVDARLRDKAIRLLSFLNYFTILNEACFQNFECNNEQLPIKNCDDNFILFEHSEKEEIRKEEKCIFLKGNETTIDKVIDAFFYEMKNKKD